MKRIISIVLAMAMVLSLLSGVPIVFAGATDGADSVRYNLLGDGTEYSAPKNADLWTASDYNVYNTNFAYLDASAEIEEIIAGNDVKDPNGNVIAKNSDLLVRLLRHTSGYFRFMTKNGDSALPNGQWFAMKLKTDKLKGFECDVKIEINDGNGIKYSVYFAPYEAGKNDGSYYMSENNKISSKTFPDGKSTWDLGRLEIGNYDEYVIVLEQHTSEQLRLDSIVFKKVPVTADYITVSFDKNEILTGTYAYPKVSAYSSSGKPASIEGAEISYSVSDDKLARINEKTGELYAKKAGEQPLTITAVVETDGKRLTDTVDVDIITEKTATAIPDELVFSFPLGYIGKGESDYIRIADKNGEHPGSGIEYTYEILPNVYKTDDEIDVLRIEEDGFFTGLNPGRVDVVATAKLGDDEKKFTFSVTVKGENLFTRHGVNHGEFERAVYLSFDTLTVGSTKITETESLWKARKDDPGSDSARDVYTFEHLQNVISDITGRRTNKIKATVDNTVLSNGQTLRVFRFESANTYYDENGTKHNGAINLKNGKIYEYTGFLKLSDVETIPDKLYTQLNFYARKEEGGKITLVKRAEEQSLSPWSPITGDMPWTGFNLGAIYVNWDEPTAVAPRVQIQQSNVKNYALNAAHFAIREVSFDRIDFKMNKTFEGAKTYDSFKTTVTPYAGSGNIIQSGNASETLKVNYYSTNPVVARVDEAGTITAVSNGECDIVAEMTLGEVTRSAKIPVLLSGLEVKFEKVSASPMIEKLQTRETTDTQVELMNTDGTLCSRDEVVLYYESNTPELATIDQNGTITAKNPGTARFTVYAKNESYTTSSTFEVKIVDNADLASVSVTGPTNVEVGFSAKLSATATHMGGAIADMSECDVKFELCDEESAEFLEILSDGETIRGIKEGNARVKVTVTCNGSTLTGEPFNIVVTPSSPTKSKTFNLIVLPSNTSALKVEIEKYGWAINQNETSKTRIDEALGGTFKNIRILKEHIQFKPNGSGRVRESSLAIDFMVDYDGWYQPVLIGKRVNNSSDSYVFVNGDYAGEFDFRAEDADVNIPMTQKLNPVYLERGVNTLKISSKSLNNLYPVRFIINWIGEEPTASNAEILIEKDKLPIGTSCGFNVVAHLNDLMDHNFGLDFDGKANTEGLIYSLKQEGDGAVEVNYSDNTLTAKTAGTVKITAEVHYGEQTFEVSKELEVTPPGFTSVAVSADSQVMAPTDAGRQLSALPLDNLGNVMEFDGSETYSYSSSDDSVVSVDQNGYVMPEGEGTAIVYVTVTFDNKVITGSISFSVREGKVKSTYYTKDKIRNARENISKYSWAKDEMKAAVETADKYLPHIDALYEMLPSQGVPRGYAVGHGTDPDIRICRYCGANLKIYGTYPWTADALTRPWKVQCQECKRLFPSNDFGAFYENGKNEHGEFHRTYALEQNGILCGRGERDEDGKYVAYEQYKDNPYGYGDPRGNLYNELYEELYKTQKDPRLGVEITQGWGEFATGGDSGVPNVGYFWGVDDGEGYETGRSYTVSGKVIPEVHTYVSTFNHIALWVAAASKCSTPAIYKAITSCRDAYLYTGNKKYAIAGAKLVDRIADFYPDYNINEYYDPDLGVGKYSNSGGEYGKIVGGIWESRNFVSEFALAYDAFFDVYDDTELISYLTEKAVKYNYADKLVEIDGKLTVTGEALRDNVEKNIIGEILPAIKETAIRGNFGFKQNTLAKAAVVLDTHPQTQEMIDFIMKPGETDVGTAECTGGNVLPQIINIVCRDGLGNESGQGYNSIWPSNLLQMSETLADYEDIDFKDNLLVNPKYIKMLQMQLVYLVAGIRTLNIGDEGTPGGMSFSITPELYLAGLKSIDRWDASDEFKEEKRILFSQILYRANGNTTEGLNYGIFESNPERLQDDIDAVIRQHGKFDGVKSTLYTGYGLATLQGGVDFRGTTSVSDLDITTRDFWMYFGGSGESHHQNDGLNIGLDAFGMNMSPDLGYPTDTGSQGGTERAQWVAGTVSHNTVVVNDEMQRKAKYAGNAMHFTDDGEIKIMDVDMPIVYPMTVDTYRRTVVSVDIDDTVSYGIDFFRIVGGDEHVYSFHAQGNRTEIMGLDMVAQPMGTYAGADIPYGDETYSASHTSGYNYLENVQRDQNPGTGRFTADFDVDKYRKITFLERDWHLRLTMLNDFNLSEVALATGRTPEKSKNSPSYDYVLARRSGKDMDTLFTSVIEPYIGKSNIKNLERVKVVLKNGKTIRSDEPVAAVKVTLNNGRVDYVVYAANNENTYIVDGLFEFCGFVGVYTVTESDKDNYVRTYLHDGTKIAENTSAAAITGKVRDFTREIAFENFIELELDVVPQDIDTDVLAGKLLDIENDGFQNGDYRIKSAVLDGNVLRLDIGDVTPIRGYVDAYDMSKGYEGNIQVGQRARIALTSYDTSAPDIEPIADHTVSAGSSISIPVKASSEYDREVKLVGTTLPRGMSIDTRTNTLTWKPDASQVGENHVAITADDGILTNTVRFTITVYGATTSTPAPDADVSGDSAESSDGSSAPAGVGGGGAGSPAPDSIQTDVEKDTDGYRTENEDGSSGISGATENLRFTDTKAFLWAESAIEELAAAGIIKGTSENTFSPGKNITRADFALLLVRAFNLTSSNTENFADVYASDYFADELAIARNNGLIGGVGGNKFAPRNSITRQDMMVIVYRALTANLAEEKLRKLSPTNEVSYSDFATVADYAKEAVSALINAELVNGKSGFVAPNDYTTRAEVAVLIKRILDYTAQ